MIKKDNLEEERNSLARSRTAMANERTLLSYYRTSFAVLGLAVFILKFYESVLSAILAGVFFLISLGLAIYGFSRYCKFKKRINSKKD